METVFRWLAGILAGILERYADPALETKLAAYKAKVEAYETERAKLIAKIDEAEREIFQLGVTLTEDLARRKQIEDAIQQSKEETARKLAELDSLSEHDRIRIDPV